jgi:PEP-CTERM motif
VNCRFITGNLGRVLRGYFIIDLLRTVILVKEGESLKVTLLSLLTVCCLMLAVAPAMADTVLYSNGPYNGTLNGYNTGYGWEVSDSFVVPSNSNIETLSIVYWDPSSSDILTTVDMAISASQLPTSGFQTITASNTFLGINGFGYALYQADFTFPSIPWSGAGWVSLQNACTTFGCSDGSAAAFWDENDGPSSAYQNNGVGVIGSESFTLNGTTGSTTTPEPSSIMLLGSGILGLAGVLRRKLTR